MSILIFYALREFLFKVFRQFFNRNAFLFHRVAVADSDGFVFERFEIHGDAIWCADLVLTAVSFADVAVVVPFNSKILFECVVNFSCLRNQFGFIQIRNP